MVARGGRGRVSGGGGGHLYGKGIRLMSAGNAGDRVVPDGSRRQQRKDVPPLPPRFGSLIDSRLFDQEGCMRDPVASAEGPSDRRREGPIHQTIEMVGDDQVDHDFVQQASHIVRDG